VTPLIAGDRLLTSDKSEETLLPLARLPEDGVSQP